MQYTKDRQGDRRADGQTDLGHDVDGTYEQLVEVAVHQQLRAVDQRVLEAGPDLLPQLVRDVQLGTQVSEPQAGQVVYLQDKGGAKKNEEGTAVKKAVYRVIKHLI